MERGAQGPAGSPTTAPPCRCLRLLLQAPSFFSLTSPVSTSMMSLPTIPQKRTACHRSPPETRPHSTGRGDNVRCQSWFQTDVCRGAGRRHRGNTSDEKEEIKAGASSGGFGALKMEFGGPFLNDGSSSSILRVISNCFQSRSYGNCRSLLSC